MKEVVRSKTFIFILIVASLLMPAQIYEMEVKSFDLVVYGATVCGVMTSVAASRHGLHVALVDPDHHVGGMMASGLSSSDVGNQAVIGGLSREVFEKVGQHSNEPIEWLLEPHVVEAVFNEFLKNHETSSSVCTRTGSKRLSRVPNDA
jgi:predicted NAD/FAD-dependent oxidoreductase